jgi:hypothetical protein
MMVGVLEETFDHPRPHPSWRFPRVPASSLILRGFPIFKAQRDSVISTGIQARRITWVPQSKNRSQETPVSDGDDLTRAV